MGWNGAFRVSRRFWVRGFIFWAKNYVFDTFAIFLECSYISAAMRRGGQCFWDKNKLRNSSNLHVLQNYKHTHVKHTTQLMNAPFKTFLLLLLLLLLLYLFCTWLFVWSTNCCKNLGFRFHRDRIIRWAVMIKRSFLLQYAPRGIFFVNVILFTNCVYT